MSVLAVSAGFATTADWNLRYVAAPDQATGALEAIPWSTELVEEKFGSVDARYAHLIAGASEDQLRRWLKGILNANAPADLFEA